jgi:hypothetical protein
MEEKKPYVNPINNLTEEQWKRAMEEGEAEVKAKSASIRRDLLYYYWVRRIPEAQEELHKAESALRAYLERPSSEPPDIARHRQLAENLKRATDDMKSCTDEYVRLTLIHLAP